MGVFFCKVNCAIMVMNINFGSNTINSGHLNLRGINVGRGMNVTFGDTSFTNGSTITTDNATFRISTKGKVKLNPRDLLDYSKGDYVISDDTGELLIMRQEENNGQPIITQDESNKKRRNDEIDVDEKDQYEKKQKKREEKRARREGRNAKRIERKHKSRTASSSITFGAPVSAVAIGDGISIDQVVSVTNSNGRPNNTTMTTISQNVVCPNPIIGTGSVNRVISVNTSTRPNSVAMNLGTINFIKR